MAKHSLPMKKHDFPKEKHTFQMDLEPGTEIIPKPKEQHTFGLCRFLAASKPDPCSPFPSICASARWATPFPPIYKLLQGKTPLPG